VPEELLPKNTLAERKRWAEDFAQYRRVPRTAGLDPGRRERDVIAITHGGMMPHADGEPVTPCRVSPSAVMPTEPCPRFAPGEEPSMREIEMILEIDEERRRDVRRQLDDFVAAFEAGIPSDDLPF